MCTAPEYVYSTRESVGLQVCRANAAVGCMCRQVVVHELADDLGKGDSSEVGTQVRGATHLRSCKHMRRVAVRAKRERAVKEQQP